MKIKHLILYHSKKDNILQTTKGSSTNSIPVPYCRQIRKGQIINGGRQPSNIKKLPAKTRFTSEKEMTQLPNMKDHDVEHVIK